MVTGSKLGESLKPENCVFLFQTGVVELVEPEGFQKNRAV